MALALIPGLPGVGPTELIILLTIILLLFGAKRIPELAKGLGSGVREFKKGTRGEYEEVDEEGKKEEEQLTAGGAGMGEDTHNARMRAEAERETDRAEQRSRERNL
jgi:sec-independent protein translocase protein TatA